MFSLLEVSTVHRIYGAADFSKQIIAAVVPPYQFAPFGFQVSEESSFRLCIAVLFHADNITASSE